MHVTGNQDELIRAVAAANHRTIVLNAGSPVAMPRADDVAAIVQLWFPRMESGNALAQVRACHVPASSTPTCSCP